MSISSQVWKKVTSVISIQIRVNYLSPSIVDIPELIELSDHPQTAHQVSPSQDASEGLSLRPRNSLHEEILGD